MSLLSSLKIKRMKKLALLYIFLLVSTLSFAQWEQVGQDIFGDTGDLYTGTSVAMNSTGEIVAVYDSFIDGTQAGRVRVFKLENSSWTQLGNDILGLLGDGQSDGRLRMNAQGTRIILSNENHQFNGEYSGGVQIYELVNNAWSQVGNTLYGNNVQDYFGTDVDMSEDGNTIIIGAKQISSFSLKSGYAQVFMFQGNSWVQKGEIIQGTEVEDGAGESVSISSNGNIVALAAPANDFEGEDYGKVTVYEYMNNSWVQRGDPIYGENQDDQLGLKTIGGSAIDLNSNGSRIAVGSISNNENNSGKLRIFEFQGNDWVQLGNTIVGTPQSEAFGQSVEMNSAGNIVVVGDPFEGDVVRGSVRVFRLFGTNWVQQGDTLFIPNEGEPVAFGWCTAINDSGNLIVVGAPLRKVNSANVGSGSVYQNDAILSTFENISIQFKLYPNPNKGIFDISFSEIQQRVTVNIVDLIGRQVVTIDYFNTNKIEVNENLKAGIYLVEITAGNTSETVRIVVE